MGPVPECAGAENVPTLTLGVPKPGTSCWLIEVANLSSALNQTHYIQISSNPYNSPRKVLLPQIIAEAQRSWDTKLGSHSNTSIGL